LRALDVGLYVALMVSALVSGLPTLVGLVRRRPVNALSAYFTTMVLGSLLVALVAGSTEFLLAKEAVLTGVTGVWFLVSAAGDRPLADESRRHRGLFRRRLLEVVVDHRRAVAAVDVAPEARLQPLLLQRVDDLPDRPSLVERVPAVVALDEDALAAGLAHAPRHRDRIAAEAAPPVPYPDPLALEHALHSTALAPDLRGVSDTPTY